MKFTKNLNSLSENEFISIFGSVFEKSEWIASDTFKKKPFKNCCGRVSDNRAPPEGMILKRGFLRGDTCDKLIAYAHKQSDDSLKVRKKLSDSEETFEEVDPLRVASRVNLGDKQKIIDTWVDDIFYKFFEKKVKQKIRSFEDPQLMKYTAGGFYKPHSDAELFDEILTKI